MALEELDVFVGPTENQYFETQATSAFQMEGRKETVLRNAHDIRCVEPLGTLLALEFDGLAFVEGLVAFFLNGGEMHEDILTA